MALIPQLPTASDGQGGSSGSVNSINDVPGLQSELDDINAQLTIDTFEKMDAHLSRYTAVSSFNGNQLSSITYSLAGEDDVVKTFNYTGTNITSITLSGGIPDGIDNVKTFHYDGNGNITHATYTQ